jgi:hypothetical protein
MEVFGLAGRESISTRKNSCIDRMPLTHTKAVIITGALIYTSTSDGFTLSPGEREGVRVSVNSGTRRPFEVGFHGLEFMWTRIFFGSPSP